jgi:hypothetical protein
VRAAPEAAGDRLDLAQERLGRRAGGHVSGDVGAVAAVGGAQQRVVGGDEADLEREPIGRPRRSTSARPPRRARARRARGTAYSSSVKRTLRGVAKTRWLRSTRVEGGAIAVRPG